MRTYTRKRHPLMRYIIICLFVLVLCACSPFGGNGTPSPRQQSKASADKQTYTIPVIGIQDFNTLDPAKARDPASISAVQMIYTGLVSLDEKLTIQPQLAQSWEVASDGVTWTFHLKPDLTFSDGSKLTAEDVAYSIDRALQPATGSRIAPLYLKSIKNADQVLAGRMQSLIGDSLRVVNPETLVIITEKPTAHFLSALTMPCSYVVQKSMIEKYGEKFTDHLNTGGGSGPFKVSHYNHRNNITFVPNTRYYGEKPQLQKVTFKIYHTPEQAHQDYQQNLLDMTTVPIEHYANDKKKEHEFHQPAQAWINYYAMNFQARPFNNIKIRQAFALAIDKEAITRSIWKDTARATNHIVPEGIPGYNANLTGPDGTKSLKGNPQKAKALLQQGLIEEGWKDSSEIPPITLSYVSGVESFDQEVTELIKQWENVLDIKVIPDPLDLNTLLDQVTAATNNPEGLQMWGLSWVGEYPDHQNWLSHQFGKNTPNNTMNYGQNTSKNAALQQIVQQQLEDADAMVQPDQAQKRLQLYQQAEQQIVQDIGWLPMEQVTYTYLRNPAIVGIQENAHSYIPPDAWSTIYRVQ